MPTEQNPIQLKLYHASYDRRQNRFVVTNSKVEQCGDHEYRVLADVAEAFYSGDIYVVDSRYKLSAGEAVAGFMEACRKGMNNHLKSIEDDMQGLKAAEEYLKDES